MRSNSWVNGLKILGRMTDMGRWQEIFWLNLDLLEHDAVEKDSGRESIIYQI